MLIVGWLLFLTLLWSVLAASFLPTPMEILRALPSLLNGELGVRLWQSLLLNFTAAGCIFVLSLAIAYSTAFPGVWGRLFRPLATIVSWGRFNGMVGLPLIFMSMLHDPGKVKIALLVFGTTVYAVLSLTDMVQAIPKEKFDLARTLRMNEWRVVWEVVVLGTFADVLSIMRVTLSMCWMLLPLVEGYFLSEGGIGAYMAIEDKHLRLETVFCVLLVITGIGFLQDLAIRLFRSTACPYADLGMERAI